MLNILSRVDNLLPSISWISKILAERLAAGFTFIPKCDIFSRALRDRLGGGKRQIMDAFTV